MGQGSRIDMKKSLLLILVIGIIIVGAAIYHFWPRTEISMPEKTLTDKKIVMVVSHRDFRDEEYFVPKGILEEAGAEIKTASDRMGNAIGTEGGEVAIDFLVSEINPADVNAVVFVGGPGCLPNLDNEDSYKLVQETIAQNKVLAAICISPVILAKAGVLNGKKATVWSSSLDKSAINILKESGANYQPAAVVVDGKIITANGPAAAADFSRAIIESLK
jgi:protease I